jgi:hypothetical protein
VVYAVPAAVVPDSLSVQDPPEPDLYVKVTLAAPADGNVKVIGELVLDGAVKFPPLWFCVIETVTVWPLPRPEMTFPYRSVTLRVALRLLLLPSPVSVHV